MTQRGVLVAGSALAAITVGYACLFAATLPFIGGKVFVGFLPEATLLAILPAALAAALAATWVGGQPAFDRSRDLGNATRITLLAFPILFLLLWPTFWLWLQFYRYLPSHERPESLGLMAEISLQYTIIAFIAGFLPALIVEYFVVRFARKRCLPALPSGVFP